MPGLVGLLLGITLTVLFAPAWGGMMGYRSGMMGGYGAGRWAGPSAGGTERLDRHFIEQMIPHHEDAVAMAQLALTEAEHQELKDLARNIQRDQTREIGEMREWYRSWYGSEVPAITGGMMAQGMRQGSMMGAMGGAADLESLKQAKEFDKEFIEQMIPHHQMAIMMAQMLLRGTERQELKTLGENIIRTQSEEIELMRGWYASWYSK